MWGFRTPCPLPPFHQILHVWSSEEVSIPVASSTMLAPQVSSLYMLTRPPGKAWVCLPTAVSYTETAMQQSTMDKKENVKREKSTDSHNVKFAKRFSEVGLQTGQIWVTCPILIISYRSGYTNDSMWPWVNYKRTLADDSICSITRGDSSSDSACCSTVGDLIPDPVDSALLLVNTSFVSLIFSFPIIVHAALYSAVHQATFNANTDKPSSYFY